MQQTLDACFIALFARHCDAFTLYAMDGRISSQNAAAERLRRISAWDEALSAPAPRAAFVEAYEGKHGSFELQLSSSEGELRVRIDVSPVVMNDAVVAVSEVARDIRVALADDYQGVAETKIPKLPILYDRMSRLLMHMRRDGRPFAVHIVNLSADGVLTPAEQEIVDLIMIDRLLETVRGTDTVGKLGPNLIVVQAEMLEDDSVGGLTERIHQALELPARVEDKEHMFKINIGSAVASRRTASVNDLLAEADLVLSRRRAPQAPSRTRRIERA